jgi:large subunit ribosomal protein L24
MQKRLHVKKDDNVVVIAGKDKGKSGKILKAYPKTERVIVEGVNVRTKHMRATKEGQQSGIIKQEGAIHISNVLLYCPKCKKGVRTSSQVLANEQKVRVCVKCGETLDK